MKNRVAIIGSGDLAEQIAYHAEQDGGMEIIGFFDDFLEQGAIITKTTKAYKILGGVEAIVPLYKKGIFDCLLVGIGYKHLAFRKAIFERFKGKVPFANFIHSSCYVDPSCQLGEGVVLFPACTLDYGVTLGDNVLLNTGCTIAHDTTIGRHTFLSPRVALAGFVTIGACCNIGINTTVIDNICIEDEVQTGGGAVVIKNLPQRGLYVGNPARFVR
jgi:sugar O-acyltransferase (sialic acid O-acetyltransferase NeuD family)